MKTYLLIAVMSVPAISHAQTTNISNYLEGGKTLVELIKVIKPQKNLVSSASFNSTDSCAIKKLADISFKNKTDKTIHVCLYFRVGNIYETQGLSLQLAPSSQENLYDVRSGIYKYRIETDTNGQKSVLQEGELKLQSCDKLVKEVKV